jgi:rfaE bifunctional protein kinase chain/domain
MKKKKVFISGHFNIIHPGHLRLFKFAKEIGDYLIVGVESNKLAKHYAHINEDLRIESVKSIKLVDEVIKIDSIPNAILKIKPNFILKGKEHEQQENIEKVIAKKIGSKLIFSSGETTYVTSDLINKEFASLSYRPVYLKSNFVQKNKIKINLLRKLINNYSKLNVCVIGDLIVDEYISCQALGMSQEDSVVVLSPSSNKKFLGGAGIVAAHASTLGAKCTLISVTGDDKHSNFIKNKLESFGVYPIIFKDESRITTLKQRFKVDNKIAMRLNYLRQNSISKYFQQKVLNNFKRILKKKIDLVIFSDFNYGCLPRNLVENLIQIANKNNCFIACDSQSSSQIGDISKFKNVNLITPTELEARISLKNNEDGLNILAEKLRDNCNAEKVILKLGREGIIMHSYDKKKNLFETDRMESFNLNPVDVAGAGDSLLVGSSMALALGAGLKEAALIGSILSAIQISREGNSPISKNELFSVI